MTSAKPTNNPGFTSDSVLSNLLPYLVHHITSALRVYDYHRRSTTFSATFLFSLIRGINPNFQGTEGFGNMRSGNLLFQGRNRQRNGKAPSLVDLCVQTAIDNVKYIGDVGATDSHLLERILPHCTVEELMHIENATTERDLSPITDTLWKKYYEIKFGAKNVEIVVDRMTKKRVSFKWRQLYQAKLKEQNEVQKQSLERLAQSFKNETARKQSRQIQFIAKVPPSSKKRSFCGAFGSSSTFSNVKSNIMKKAKVEYRELLQGPRCHETRELLHIQGIPSKLTNVETSQYEVTYIAECFLAAEQAY
ncbi:hypothetical protein KSS87_014690 [Heliosperma pusillum]|nr:hypothetical protein KSS87_014690 [Heliosperma pusillum]